jgi:hypothetical protein
MPEQCGQDMDAIVAWLVDRIASELKVAPETISVDEAFANLGLSSLQILLVTGDLGEYLGIDDMEVSLFWNYPTILKLADHLVGLPRGTVSA